MDVEEHNPLCIDRQIIDVSYINSLISSKITSNARLKTRSALSRRNDVSKLPPNYLLIQFYSSVNPYKKIFFCKKVVPCVKK